MCILGQEPFCQSQPSCSECIRSPGCAWCKQMVGYHVNESICSLMEPSSRVSFPWSGWRRCRT